MATLREEFEELLEMNRVIESPAFQKFIAKPMKDYRYEQKNSFFSDTLKDSWRKGGRVETVNMFFKILERLNKDLHNKKLDLDREN